MLVPLYYFSAEYETAPIVRGSWKSPLQIWLLLYFQNLVNVISASKRYGPPDHEDRKRRKNFDETVQLRQCTHNCHQFDVINRFYHGSYCYVTKSSNIFSYFIGFMWIKHVYYIRHLLVLLQCVHASSHSSECDSIRLHRCISKAVSWASVPRHTRLSLKSDLRYYYVVGISLHAINMRISSIMNVLTAFVFSTN